MKKIKKLEMNALMGVAQGSVKPPRVLVMKWNGKKDRNFANPIGFIGKALPSTQAESQLNLQVVGRYEVGYGRCCCSRRTYAYTCY